MDIKEIENLAQLARIELNEEEKKEILSDMQGILEYVKQIEKADTRDMEGEFETRNVWREDLPAGVGEIEARDFSRELILEQFPDAQAGFLKVKKIL